MGKAPTPHRLTPLLEHSWCQAVLVEICQIRTYFSVPPNLHVLKYSSKNPGSYLIFWLLMISADWDYSGNCVWVQRCLQLWWKLGQNYQLLEIPWSVYLPCWQNINLLGLFLDIWIQCLKPVVGDCRVLITWEANQAHKKPVPFFPLLHLKFQMEI